jgi:HK97 family phage portal protein
VKSPLGAIAERLTRNQAAAPVPYSGRSTVTVPWAQPLGTEAQMRAMGSVGTLFSIVNRTSVSSSAVNWRLWRKARSGKPEDRVEVTTHAALAVLNKPNDFYTRQELVEAGQQHIDLTGEGYLIIARHAAMSVPFELWPVRPDRMSPIPDRDNFLVGWVYTSPDGEKIPLPRADVIQIRMPNPLDPYRGMGPVQALLADLDSIKYSAEWNRNFFLNSAEPGGIIEVDRRLSDDEFDEMTTRWREQHQGVAQAHRVAVLEQAKWVDRKFSMRDMQFAELRQIAGDTIREAFGMPKFAVGIVEDVNRATAEASKAWFAEELTVPRVERWKQALNNDFLPQFGSTATGLEFDYDDPVPANSEANNADRESKALAAQAYVSAGYTGDSVIKALDLPSDLVWEKPAKPTPPAAPPPPAQDGPVPTDRLSHSHPAGHRNGPTEPPPAGQPQHLPPDQLPDISPAKTALDAALAALLIRWAALSAVQKTHIVDTIRQLAAHGRLADLAAMHVDSTDTAAALYTAMTQLAAIAARQVVAEAAAQDVDIAAASVPAAELQDVADLTAALLADELKVAAARAAMRANGPAATAEQVAQVAQDALDQLPDTGPQRQLGGALHGSINAARVATIRVGPAGAIYAQEMNDKSTCAPCRDINGRWLANTDDLAPLELTYPAGAYGGYIGCLGRENCRGTVVGVWRPATTAGGAG